MKNQLNDLNNYLFECIERINDDELSEENLDKEIKKAETIQKVAKTIIDNAQLALSAQKHFDEYGTGKNVEIPLLTSTEKKPAERSTASRGKASNVRA